MTGYPSSFITYFKSLSITLTSLRKAVLFSLWQAKKPLKVHEIIEDLVAAQFSATATSVYRVLDFFMEAGLLHKIESIQAYALCLTPDHKHSTEMLMICDKCHDMTEAHDETLRFLLTQLASNAAFKISEDVIELKGICHACQ
jgi:Fur family transcriptional regulator, zinc uptake regulator